MKQYIVDKTLVFEFPDDWLVSKYDDWLFYKKEIPREWRDGVKAVDLLAIEPGGTVWLIEAREHRSHRRTKVIDLGEEIAHKAFDTVAGLFMARLHAQVPAEKELANKVTAARELRVVLHLEQPAKQSRLRPCAIDPSMVQQKIRRLLRLIDVHPQVVEKQAMRGLGWRVL